MRILALSIVLVLMPVSLYASGRSEPTGLAARVAQLEAQVAAMEEILQYVHVETEEVNGLAGPHWIIEGANVHVRSGSGNTPDFCTFTDPEFPSCESLTGLGNLIVGYNEFLRSQPPNMPLNIRTGSHNLILGRFHSYSSFAGLVAGSSNRITGPYASVSGGSNNVASGDFSSVSGGHSNEARGSTSSVSGGADREALDAENWAAGSLFESN